jgi:hypothetical protein
MKKLLALSAAMVLAAPMMASAGAEPPDHSNAINCAAEGVYGPPGQVAKQLAGDEDRPGVGNATDDPSGAISEYCSHPRGTGQGTGLGPKED